MTPGGFVVATGIQLGTFLAPLTLAWAGFVSGELAGLVAIVGCFLVGVPLSYAVVDKMDRRPGLASAVLSRVDIQPERAHTQLQRRAETSSCPSANEGSHVLASTPSTI